MRQMVSEVQRASAQSQQHVKGLDSAMAGLATTAKAVGVAFAAMGVAQLGKEAIAASTQMTALDTAFKAITGSATAAKAELGFVRAESQRLGLNFVSTAEQFKGLTAAAKGTTLEGDQIRKTFVAITSASRTLGLSTEQTSGALNAVAQMISKGVVQSEELRGQLGERLPGAFQIAARAMGVTTAELGKMLEAGLDVTEFLPKFSAQVQKELGGGAAEAANTFQAATVRLDNATAALSAALGDLITKNPQVVQGVNDIATAVSGLAVTIKESTAIPAFVSTLLKLGTMSVKGLAEFVTLPPENLRQIQVFNEALLKQQEILMRLETAAAGGGRSFFEAFGLPFGLGGTDLASEIAKVRVEIERLTTARDALIKALPAPSGAVTTLFAGADLPHGGAVGGTIARRLKAYEESFSTITRLQADILRREKDLAEAPLLGLTPEKIAILDRELTGMRDNLAKVMGQLTSTEATQKAETALKKQAAADKAHAEAVIASYRRQGEADEELREQQAKARDQYLADELHAAKTIDGYRKQFSDEAIKAKEEETKVLAGLTKERVAAELQEQKEAAREFKRQQEQTIQDVSNVMFSFLHNLGQGAESMQDIWRDTLDSIKALFLRTLTDMAAQALVKQILIPVGVTSGAGGAQPICSASPTLGAGGWHRHHDGARGRRYRGRRIWCRGADHPLRPRGSTAGTAVAGVGTGLTVGLVSNDLLQQAGRGLAHLASPGGCGWWRRGRGDYWAPPPFIGAPVGAVIGAVVGAAVPSIMHPAGQRTRSAQLCHGHSDGAGPASWEPFLRGAALRGPFGFVGPPAPFSREARCKSRRRSLPAPFWPSTKRWRRTSVRRQVDIAAAALQAQGRGVTIKFEEFDNELADITKDRMQTILGALAKEAGIAGHRGFRGRVLRRALAPRKKTSPAWKRRLRNATAFLETLSQLKDPEKPLSQAEQALKALTDQFADFADQARQYGVSLKVIDEAMRRQVHDFWKSVVDNLKTQQAKRLAGHWGDAPDPGRSPDDPGHHLCPASRRVGNAPGGICRRRGRQASRHGARPAQARPRTLPVGRQYRCPGARPGSPTPSATRSAQLCG